MNASHSMMNPYAMKVSEKKASRALVAGFWIFTALFFCLEMLFTAYYELLVLPQAAQAFARLGFPAASFRVELSMGQSGGRGRTADAHGPRAGRHLRDQGVGLRRLRDQPHLGAHRPPLDQRPPPAFVPSALTTRSGPSRILLAPPARATPAAPDRKS